MHSAVTAFEDTRWRGWNSSLGFRHQAALGMIGEGTVLDLGCGDGIVLAHLKNKKSDLYGLDVSPEAVKKCAEQGIEAKVFDFSTEALPFPDKAFEYVVMLDVLEHVYNPAVLLAEAARVSNTFVIISVPNFNSLPARLQVFLGRVPENNTPHKGHIYWFNYGVLRTMLRGAHLTVADLRMNTFYESVPLLGSLTRFLCRVFPNIFALSFVVKVTK